MPSDQVSTGQTFTRRDDPLNEWDTPTPSKEPPPPVIIQGQEPAAPTATPLMGSPNPAPPPEPAPLDAVPGSSAELQLEAPPAEQMHARIVRLEKLVDYLMNGSHRFASILAETEHLLHIGGR